MKIKPLNESKKLKEGWAHFEFTSGANPYIAKTRDEADRIKRRYDDAVRYIGNIDGTDYYKVDDREEDLFSVDEDLEWNTYKITYIRDNGKEYSTTFKTWQSDVEYAWRMSPQNIPHTKVKSIELVETIDESKHLNETTYGKDELVDILEKSRYTSFVVDEGDYIKIRGQWRKSTRMADSDYINIRTLLNKMLGVGNFELVYERNDIRDDGKERSCSLRLVLKNPLKEESKSWDEHQDIMQRKTSGYDKCYKIVKKARTSNPVDTDALDDARDHFGDDLYKMCLDDVLKEMDNLDEAFKPKADGIQSVKVYNQYNYTIQELRIDNDKKTFERGNFTMGKPDKKTKNRQEFEDIVDELKKLGYEEIPSDYHSLRNKTRKGVSTKESYWIENKEVMDEVSRLEKQLENDGWNKYTDKYSGSKYYSIFARRGENGGEFKAVKYNHDHTPEIVDLSYRQIIGDEPLDSFDGLRRSLGRALLPKRESMKEDCKAFGAKAKKLQKNESIYSKEDHEVKTLFKNNKYVVELHPDAPMPYWVMDATVVNPIHPEETFYDEERAIRFAKTDVNESKSIKEDVDDELFKKAVEMLYRMNEFVLDVYDNESWLTFGVPDGEFEEDTVEEAVKNYKDHLWLVEDLETNSFSEDDFRDFIDAFKSATRSSDYDKSERELIVKESEELLA